MKSWLSFIFCTVVSTAGYTQDSILHRIIFIGEATGKSGEEQIILQHAIANVC